MFCKQSETTPKEYGPMSSVNKPIQVSDIIPILHRYGLPPKVHNIALYQRAFVHTNTFNQRVEFLGDALLNTVSSVFLYMKYKDKDEGFLTQQRSKIVNNIVLGNLAIDVLQLQQYVICDEGAEKHGLRGNIKYMGSQFEAFLGAMFLDFNKTDLIEDTEVHKDILMSYGFQMVQIFLTNLYNQHIDFDNLGRDYKSEIFKRVQALFTPNHKILHYHLLRQQQTNPGCGFAKETYTFTVGLILCPTEVLPAEVISSLHMQEDGEEAGKEGKEGGGGGGGRCKSIDDPGFGTLESIWEYYNNYHHYDDFSDSNGTEHRAESGGSREVGERWKEAFLLATASDGSKKKAEKLCAMKLMRKLDLLNTKTHIWNDHPSRRGGYQGGAEGGGKPPPPVPGPPL